MIDFHAWSTPNGRKVAIALEETGLPYEVKPVDITKGEQHDPSFLEISPNNKIPAIVDHAPKDGRGPLPLFESAAIGIYLCRKAESPLLGTSEREEPAVLAWTMFQMASVGPMFGQLGHFVLHADEDVPYARDRYLEEVQRLLRVIDRRLGGTDHLAGPCFTLADAMTYPWVAALSDMDEKIEGLDLGSYPATGDWLARCAGRPGVARGMEASLTEGPA